MGRPRLAPAIALISAATLAYEILLVRLFAVEQFHHFASMAIGVALLGSGVSGTLGALWPPADARAGQRRLQRSAAATALALVASPWAAHAIRIDPTQLAWAVDQWLRLALLVLALAIPFFAGGLALVTAFPLQRQRTGVLYGASFVGGALGVTVALAVLFLLPPARALVLPPLLGALGCLVLGRAAERAVAVGAAVAGIALFLGPGWEPRLTPYKALSQLAALPDARRVAERTSPLGWVVAMSAPSFHQAPGLSLAFRGELPPQTALLLDGDLAGAATDVRSGDVDALADALPGALPHAVGARRRVLLVGVGDGLALRGALAHGAERVVTVEPDGTLLRLSRALAPPSADEATRVEDRVGHLRTVLGAMGERFDLIAVEPSGGHGSSVGGVRALDEDFLHTVEAYRLGLERLTPEGVLAVTRWLSVPPRESVRTVLTVAEALRRMGRGPEGFVVIRSWATVTVLCRPQGFRPEELDRLQMLARERGLDIDWPPAASLGAGSVNRLDDPSLRLAAEAAVSGEAAARFAASYPFDVAPRDDARPYPHHYLRPRGALNLLRNARGGSWLPFAEWGPIAVAATLVQAVGISAFLLLLPAALWARRGKAAVGLPVLIGYFALLGFAYVAVEIAAIQQLGLLLGHPLYAVAAVLGTCLVCSGAGSAFSDRLAPAWGPVVCLSLFALLVLGVAALLGWVHAWLPAPEPVRVGAVVVCLAPAACAMGMPFPLGLRALAPSGGEVAWAWAANGFASVVAAPLCALLALEGGIRVVLGAAAAAYALAGVLLWSRTGQSPRLVLESGPGEGRSDSVA